MENKIEEIKRKISEDLVSVKTGKALFELKVKYLIGKAGEIPSLMKELGKAPKEDRPKLGQIINGLKEWAAAAFENKEAEIGELEKKARYTAESIDITMPSRKKAFGTLHPVSIVKAELIDVFAGMGFTVMETREIEDDFHNFTIEV